MDTESVPVFQYNEFAKELEHLRELLKIPPHADPQVILNAAFHIVQHKFSVGGNTTTPVNLLEDPTAFPLGFDTKDSSLNRALLILRLLYIRDLRNLQTRINETIAVMQGYTAHPQTDSSLGRVGR